MSGEYILDGSKLTLVEALPISAFAPAGGEAVMARMKGATLVGIGAPAEDGIEGGGLIIDYIPRGSKAAERVVFAFNELGMWVVASG